MATPRYEERHRHTLVEIEGEAGWYAADPTFGYVYVKDASGARLSVQALLQSLEHDPAGKGLTFGLVYRDNLLHGRQTAHRL
jgi:hypothetical protein